MARQIINIGNAANDGNGETLRSGGVKINENFAELYAALGMDSTTTFVNEIIAGNGISVSPGSGTGNVTITNTKPYINSFNTVAVAGQTPFAATSLNQTLTLVAGSNVTLTTSPVSGSVTIAATQQQVDWSAASGPTHILNKPAIPAAQIQSDWTQSNVSAFDFIKNKPLIPTDIGQLSDLTGLLAPNYKIISSAVSLNPSQTRVVFTNDIPVVALRLLISVQGSTGGTEVHQQICEMFIVKSTPASGNPVINSTTTGLTFTANQAMATFSAAWNSATGAIELSATNTFATAGCIMVVSVVATEIKPNS